MTDTTDSGQPEGGALPVDEAPLAPAQPISTVQDAIERWYAKHFHDAVIDGRTPITVDEKASLIQSVNTVVAPATKE